MTSRGSSIDFEQPNVAPTRVVHELDTALGDRRGLFEVDVRVALRDLPADDFDEQLPLRSEVAVDRALGELRSFRDVAHRHRVVTPLDEESAGRVEQQPPSARRLRGPWWL